MKNKGQAAIETTFIALFIAVALTSIVMMTVQSSANISDTAQVRAMAQGVAAKLSMQGTKTHIIKIDDDPDDPGVIIHVVSTKCGSAELTLELLEGVNDVDCVGDAQFYISRPTQNP